jgi:hypothetical protein
MTQQIWDLVVIGSLNSDYLGQGPTLATTTIGAQTGLADEAGLQRLLDQTRQLGATIT